MKVTTRIAKPKDVVLEIIVSMTLNEWCSLKHDLSTSHPSWAFGQMLGIAIKKMETEYVEEIEYERT